MTTTSNQPPKVTDFGAASINRSQLSEPVKEVLHAIQNEVSGAYRESFILMMDELTRQASRLDRIQETLSILVGVLQPQLQDRDAPAAFRIAGPDEAPDVAAAIMVADPIGSGYTLSQGSIAKALGINQADVSVLARAFDLSSDAKCAVVVRRGKQREIVNYHPRAVERLKQLIAKPPKSLDAKALKTLDRVRRRIDGRDEKSA